MKLSDKLDGRIDALSWHEFIVQYLQLAWPVVTVSSRPNQKTLINSGLR